MTLASDEHNEADAQVEADDAEHRRDRPRSVGHNYIGHNYIGHNYTRHNYISHNYKTIDVIVRGAWAIII